MTRTLYVLIGAATVLSLGHHVDHVFRGATGWPLAGGVNAFTFSLLVYPAIAAGLLLSAHGRAGSRFWSVFASAGALFVLSSHVGPVAGDSVTKIADAYSSPVASAVALAWLGIFVATLIAAALHDALLWYRGRESGQQRRHSQRADSAPDAP